VSSPTGQATGQATGQISNDIFENIRRTVMIFSKITMKRESIQNALGLKHRVSGIFYE
jgi:hypothetical protein